MILKSRVTGGDYFAQKGYCPHLAAVEYYLKMIKSQRLLARTGRRESQAKAEVTL